MNKKNIKTEKKIDTNEVKKAEVKKNSTFKKKRKLKKIYHLELLTFIQPLTIQ